MYEEHESPLEELVHLYVDGAFSRRELIRRVAVHTGSLAAALTVLSGYELHAQTAPGCPADANVPADAPDLIVADVQFQGAAGPLFGYFAYPRPAYVPNGAVPTPQSLSGLIVVHENRGLVEHIRDVTRRAARGGFAALAVDLLSRQGGTAQFTDPTAQAQAYARTTADERLADLKAGFTYLTSQNNVQPARIGAVGFCAGGGNVWNMAVNMPNLAAAAVFYGTPVPSVDQIDSITAPVLAMYAELDRALTLQSTNIATAMISKQKTVGYRIYQGVGHAFHNDTGPAYNPAAACDAWNQALAWFDKFLLRPVPQVESTVLARAGRKQ